MNLAFAADSMFISELLKLPNVISNRKYLEDFASKSFTFFFKRLKRNYTRQLKHLGKTYITQEDPFVNGRISMQHTNYGVTAKHYIDRKEIAKQMSKQGFRIFPKKSSEIMILTEDETP